MHPAELCAPVQGGENLTGIEQLGWVEGAFDPLLLIEVQLVKLDFHQIALFHANTVFSGQNAADLNCGKQACQFSSEAKR